MKKFLAIFCGKPDAMMAWRNSDSETMKKQMAAGLEGWTKWATDNKDSIVDLGTPIGKTKRIDKSGISDIKNEIGAYTIVQAETHEDAAKIFVSHPHFMLFPGERVEIMECLPRPGM